MNKTIMLTIAGLVPCVAADGIEQWLLTHLDDMQPSLVTDEYEELPLPRSSLGAFLVSYLDKKVGAEFVEGPNFPLTLALQYRSEKKAWTIHGLWPPETDCKKFDEGNTKVWIEKMDAARRKEMDEKWPSNDGPGTNAAFWEHEYTKHGTCMWTDTEETKNCNAYFREALLRYNAHKDTCDKEGCVQSSDCKIKFERDDSTYKPIQVECRRR